MTSFPSYSLAKRHAEAVAKDLAKGSQVTALQPAQARDALAALELLRTYHQETGRNVSLFRAVTEYVEVSRKGHGRALADMVEGYLSTVATVTRKDVLEAVEEFIKADEPRTKATEGQRAQLSSEYARIRGLRLRRFAKAFPGHAVCDLSKDHLDRFIQDMADASPKARNHHRAGIKQFLQWCVRKDYLPTTHRLNEADTMRPEHANNGETGIYTAKELRVLLEKAPQALQSIIAIGGFAGLRTAEILRLTWEDVWRIEGHIEISQTKSKTRSRRLVEICPALAAWLETCRKPSGKLWLDSERRFHKAFVAVCDEAKVSRKPNALRHSFCSHHFAYHANENLTAAQAGNSPAMIHAHYKGLATKAEAEKWFNVMPSASAEKAIPQAAASRSHPQ
jgi:integrase